MGKLKPEDEEPNTHGIEFYIAAFRELGTCRDTSTTSPIPFTSILEYWKVYKSGDFDEFLYFIRLMDDKLIKLESNKPKSEKK